jgi:hypothetical protein
MKQREGPTSSDDGSNTRDSILGRAMSLIYVRFTLRENGAAGDNKSIISNWMRAYYSMQFDLCFMVLQRYGGNGGPFVGCHGPCASWVLVNNLKRPTLMCRKGNIKWNKRVESAHSPSIRSIAIRPASDDNTRRGYRRGRADNS